MQWLRLHTSNTGGKGLIPGWETKILHASQHNQKFLKIQNIKEIYLEIIYSQVHILEYFLALSAKKA